MSGDFYDYDLPLAITKPKILKLKFSVIHSQISISKI